MLNNHNKVNSGIRIVKPKFGSSLMIKLAIGLIAFVILFVITTPITVEASSGGVHPVVTSSCGQSTIYTNWWTTRFIKYRTTNSYGYTIHYYREEIFAYRYINQYIGYNWTWAKTNNYYRCVR